MAASTFVGPMSQLCLVVCHDETVGDHTVYIYIYVYIIIYNIHIYQISILYIHKLTTVKSLLLMSGQMLPRKVL